MVDKITDKRVESITELTIPVLIRQQLKITDSEKNIVTITRNEIEKVLDNKLDKLIVIIGPCSIHNIEDALEYADFLKEMRDLYKDTLIILMRTYFTKPRTNIGWKGFMYDPDLNGTYDIKSGIYKSRELLINILKKQVPCTMEHLDTISPQYFDDLLSWVAIGARTTESQIHRELASGLSTPVGFKNGTGGSIELAINAIISSSQSHHFLGCNLAGNISSIKTKGNNYCHVIMRGGKHGPNYYRENINNLRECLKQRMLPENCFVDFSHGNSEKQFKKQLLVCDSVCQQIKTSEFIKGVMIESNLCEGNQLITDTPLKKGVSVTDGCVGLVDSKLILEKLHEAQIVRQNYLSSQNI